MTTLEKYQTLLEEFAELIDSKNGYIYLLEKEIHDLEARLKEAEKDEDR